MIICRGSMALCDLCLSVPFLSLPSLPSSLDAISTVARISELKQVGFSSRPGEDIQNEAKEGRCPFGFAFHRDLSGLESSANSCCLCKIVHAGVRAWLDMWEHAAANDKAFVEFQRGNHPIPTDQQLWLTACSNRQQGFYVWAQNPANKSWFYLLTVIGFSVESSEYFDVSYMQGFLKSTKQIFAANPLAEIFPARPLVQDSASIFNLDLVATWLRRCAEGHTNEECSKSSTKLPTRVLDVGVVGDIIRLVDGDQYEGKYAALSYCVRSVQMSYIATLHDAQLTFQFGYPVGKLPSFHYVA